MFLRIEPFFTGDKLCQHSIKSEQHEQLADAREDVYLDQCGYVCIDLHFACNS
jgi:hypothetical protein